MSVQDPPEITNAHIRIAYWHAHQLASPFIDIDELKSEALVVLWDLALSWDPAKVETFAAYIHMLMRNRLIDWVRSQYGRPRPDGSMPAKMLGTMQTGSLDKLMENDDRYGGVNDNSDVFTDRAPGPEQVAVGRADVERLNQFLSRSSPYQRELLLSPLGDETQSALAARYGKTQPEASYDRRYQLLLARTVLGRIEGGIYESDQVLRRRRDRAARAANNSNPNGTSSTS